MTKRVPAKGITADTVRVADQRQQALKLKVAGATYDAIARTLGYAAAMFARNLPGVPLHSIVS
jgi:hypothetical protein